MAGRTFFAFNLWLFDLAMTVASVLLAFALLTPIDASYFG
jgi:hypothetical protein